MRIFDKLITTVDRLSGSYSPYSVDGQVVGEPEGYERPTPITLQSFVPRMDDDFKLALLLIFGLIALALVTRK